MKQNKTMAVLAGILLILIAVYFGITAWNDSQSEKEAKAIEEAEIYLTKEENLTAFTYSDSENELTFIKDGVWYLEEDRGISLQQSNIEEIERLIADCRAERKLESPDELADYGLEEPAYQIEYKTEDGKEVKINIGSMGEDYYYANIEDEHIVYTISTDLIDILQFDLNQLVKLDEVPYLDTENIRKVEVSQAGKTTIYNKEEEMISFAEGFGALYLTTCENYNVKEEEKAAYGLDEEQRTMVKVTYSNSETSSVEEETQEIQETEEFIIYVGNEDETETYHYLMVAGSDIVYLIENSNVSSLITVEKSE